MASRKDTVITLEKTGGSLKSPDIVLYDRGNCYVSKDEKYKVIIKGNTIECYGFKK